MACISEYENFSRLVKRTEPVSPQSGTCLAPKNFAPENFGNGEPVTSKHSNAVSQRNDVVSQRSNALGKHSNALGQRNDVVSKHDDALGKHGEYVAIFPETYPQNGALLSQGARVKGEYVAKFPFSKGQKGEYVAIFPKSCPQGGKCGGVIPRKRSPRD